MNAFRDIFKAVKKFQCRIKRKLILLDAMIFKQVYGKYIPSSVDRAKDEKIEQMKTNARLFDAFFWRHSYSVKAVKLSSNDFVYSNLMLILTVFKQYKIPSVVFIVLIFGP